MTLKTSCNKLDPALKLFLFTLRKNWGLLVLICILAALFCPGYLLTSVTSQIEDFGSNIDYSVNYNEIMPVIAAITSVATSLAAIFMNFINFSYLYTKKSSDVFHALPLTRCELLFSRFFAGYVFSVIPMILIYGSAALIGLMPRVEGDLGFLGIAFCYNLCITLFSSAISMIFIISAGTALDMVLSLGSYGFGSILMGAIVLTMCDEVLVGYGNDNIRDVLSVLSPFIYCGYSLLDFCESIPEFKPRYLGFFAVSLLLSVAIMALCAWLYKRRKAEKAGDSYAYRFVYVICGIILSFIGAFGLGIIFGEGNFGSIPYFIFALAGSLITAVIFGAVSYRGFKTVKSSLLIGATSFAGMIILTVILATGGFGYTTRVPEISKIESATVSVGGEQWASSPELITALHKKIVNNLDEANGENHNSSKEIGIFYSGGTVEIIEDKTVYESQIDTLNINFDYKLKNGRELTRYFLINIDAFEKELLDIYTSDERIADITKRANIVLDYASISQSFANKDYNRDYFWHPVNLNALELRSLLAAYAEDVKLATAASLYRVECDGYDVNWESGLDNYSSRYYGFSMYVEPHFEKTNAILSEIDIPTRAKELMAQ